MNTRTRILQSATQVFGNHGYGATSLDALAAELGITKQSVLYHFGSKAQLLDAVVEQAAADLADSLEEGLLQAGPGMGNVEACVRAAFRLAVRRPELLGIVREVSRLGDPWVARVVEALDPLLKRATEFLQSEMDAGRMRRSDPRLLLVSVYSTVTGVATEAEVLRAVGIEPSLRTTARRRRELIDFLENALSP